MFNRTENSILHETISKLMLEKGELEQENKKLKEELEKYEIENKKLRNSLNMKDGTIVGLKHQVKRLEDELNKIKKRVKEHTTYSVKAEFIKKFGE